MSMPASELLSGAMLVSKGHTATGTMPELLPGAMVTSKPGLLLGTMSGCEAQKQSESGMMSIPDARVTKQGVLGTMSVKIRGAH